MSRRGWLGLGLLIALAGPLSAQEKYSIAETYLTPATYYVGDEVELRLVILPAGPLTVVKSKDLPSLPWVIIKNVDYVYDQPYYQITIRFISFAPGTRILPKIVLGDLTLDNLRIMTSSLLKPDGGDELAPPREQLLVPQTELVIFGLILVMVLLPFLILRLVVWLRRSLGPGWSTFQEGSPLRNLLRDLRRLKQRAFALPADDFYGELTQAAKHFLSRKYRQNLKVLTTAELEPVLDRLLPASDYPAIMALLRRADETKFGDRATTDQQRLDDLELVRRFAADLNKKEAAGVDV